MTSRNIARLLLGGAALVLGLASTVSGQPKSKQLQAIKGLAYDVKAKKLYFCNGIVTCSADQAPVFDPGRHFFRTGDVLILRVLNARILTQYSVQIDKVSVAEATPAIRGMDDAASAPAGPTGATGGKGGVDDIQKVAIKPMSVAEYRKLSDADLLGSLTTMQNSIAAIDAIEVNALTALPQSPVALQTIPGSSIADMLVFAAALKKDIDAALVTDPYNDADGFDVLARRTDALGNAVKALKSDDPNVATFAEASKQWRIYFRNLAEANKLEPARRQPIAAQLAPISRTQDGDIYDMQAPIFDGMNRLFLKARQPYPVDISLGTFDANYQVFFHLYEKQSFTPYAFQAASASNQQAATTTPDKTANASIALNQQAPGAADATPKTTATNPTTTNPSASAQNQTPDLGKDICDRWFTVHKIYHANLVAGYTVGFLKNRSFDLQTPSSSSSSSSSSQKQIIQSNNSGIQTHYLVGLSYYLPHPADMFPGYRPALKPAILVGATPDSADNFFVGLNLETKLGLNFTGGFQLGTVTSLQQNYQVGNLTSASSAPTRTSPHGAAFVGVGFDYKVFVAFLGKVSGVKSAGTGTAQTGSKTTAGN